MHTLLAPQTLSAAKAVEACDRFLAGRWRRWAAARRLLPRDTRDDLTALLAWHAVTRELLETAPDADVAHRALPDCTGVLDDIAAGEFTCAMAAALAPAIQRHRLPDSDLRDRLRALERNRHVHAYETREELLALARRIAHPEARGVLRLLGADTERNVVLAEALATGLQWTAWITGLSGFLARGSLPLPMAELARHGVELRRIGDGTAPDAAWRRAIGAEIAGARAWLAKGWPLCAALGPWTGRRLAFVLRWHAAALSAVEARGGDVLSGPPPAGWWRLAACVMASLGGRGTPW